MNTKEEYDELAVAACKYCKSLYIVVDGDGNDVCGRCHSMNEIEIYDNIEEWEKANRIGEAT